MPFLPPSLVNSPKYSLYKADKQHLSIGAQIMPDCYTCSLISGDIAPAEGIIFLDENILINHHGRITGLPDRTGWIIVFPRRHYTQLFELSIVEQTSLVKMLSKIDTILTEEFGSKRNMIASLGWFVEDHLHFHCVPTFGEMETNGYLNFGEAYVPVTKTIEEVSEIVRKSIKK